LSNAVERVHETKVRFEARQLKEYGTNVITFEKGEERKRRKIASASRRLETALVIQQDEEDKFMEFKQFCRKEVAETMRIFDQLERIQYSSLLSLYQHQVHLRMPFAEASAKLAKLSIDKVMAFDVEADVANFINANMSRKDKRHPG
jgi:hypothetical protein